MRAQVAPTPHVIDIRIQRLEALYQTLDPSPFREKSLHPDFEAWLRDCAAESAGRVPLRLLVHARAELAEHGADLSQAIHAHFAWLLARHRRQQQVLRRRHWWIVLVGIAVLSTSLLLNHMLTSNWPALRLLSEGLAIFGWVALWRPLDVLLFDRHSARGECLLLGQLAQIEVVWRHSESLQAG